MRPSDSAWLGRASSEMGAGAAALLLADADALLDADVLAEADVLADAEPLSDAELLSDGVLEALGETAALASAEVANTWEPEAAGELTFSRVSAVCPVLTITSCSSAVPPEA